VRTGSPFFLIKKGETMSKDKWKLKEYPDEDLYEDGELSDDNLLGDLHDFIISEVEYKILQLWRNDKIVIARWEKLK
tara:strand:- start:122 stop:352 length:231 start_codon:yes stop_codon:yes gene_type:complete